MFSCSQLATFALDDRMEESARMINFNEGKSISSSSTSASNKKEKSAPQPPPPPPPPQQASTPTANKGFTIEKIIAIVAFILVCVAIGLSAYLTT